MVDHKLYEKDLWRNPDILYLFNTEIIEYDMEEAGYSLIREFKLLPESVIEKLSCQSKQSRHVSIGKIEIKNKTLVERKKKAFIEARKLFMESNKLNKDDILSVKKDAIFVTKRCKHQRFGKYINFREKNVYTAFVSLTRTIDIFYKPSTLGPGQAIIEVKGISDEKVDLHREYFVDILKKYFYKIENATPEETIRFLVRMIDKYKAHKFVEIGYYRDFDNKSAYTLLNPDAVFDNDEEMIQDIDITINLKHLIHLIKISL